MRHIMIDEQKVVEFTPVIHDHPEEGRTVVLSFTDAHRVLDEWQKLAPSRRAFRYGNDADDNEPSKIIVAEAIGRPLATPILRVEELDPYWDGVGVLNQYPLEELAGAMSYALKWGAEIDEEDI